MPPMTTRTTRRRVMLLVVLGCLMLQALTAAACGALPFGVGKQPRPLPPARAAFVAEDGQVSVLPLAGGTPQRVSDVATYLPQEAAPGRQEPSAHWPAWSPDGARLAFVRMLMGSTDTLIVAQLWTVLPDGSDPRKVWEADDQEPIYFAWAPNSRQIAMLVQREDDLDLVLLDTGGSEPTRWIGRGNPLYYVWSADSTALLVHVGSTGQSGTSKPELGIIRLGRAGSEPDSYRTLGVIPSEFRTPGWSADGRTAAFVAPGPDGAPAVSVVSPEGGDVTRLAATSSFTALALAGDGTRLAWSKRSEQDRIAYDGLEVVTTDGRTRTQVTADLVVAFAWSPDGQRLAFAALDPGNRGLAWYVADAAGANARRLGPFSPSLEQIRLLAFFDQYATSHGLWAPDSSALVYAVGIPGEQRLFGGPSAGAVQVLAVDGGAQARTLTAGNFVALPVPAP